MKNIILSKINAIDTYYRILELPTSATKEEIKRAYRKRAKELHPDINPSRDAHEQFILLTEAYEYLINPGAKKKKTVISYEDWVQTQREATRTRARAHARMRYEEFKKTEYYKQSEAIHTIVEHFYFVSSILIFISPIILFFIYGIGGSVAGIFIIFLTVHYWAGVITDNFELSFKLFIEAVMTILKSKTFSVIIIIFINFYFFTQITLNTQIKISIIVLSIILFYFSVYLINERYNLHKKVSSLITFLCILPTVFNLFFVLNYSFSSHPEREHYLFIHEKRWYGGSRLTGPYRLERIAYINLENRKYDEYKWFRVFYDFEAMKDKSKIEYTFEDGLFGFRVLKSYKFIK